MILACRQKLSPHVLPLIVLTMVLMACYAPALDHEFINSWDDYWYVQNNEAVRGFSLYHLKTAFSSFYVGNYAPLQIVSYMFDYTLWGLKPSGFIAGNILFHALNGYLLYYIVYHLQQSRLWATLASFLFLLHPVQVESVVWISQRKNVLAMFFFLLAFIGYRLYQESSGQKRVAWYSFSLVCFLFSLLTKSVAVIFPLMIIVFDCTYGSKDIRRYWNKVPFFILAILVALLALESQSSGRSEWHGGSPLSTLFTMLPVFVHYLYLILWPEHLSPIYSSSIKTALDFEVIGAALLGCIAIGVAYYLYKKERQLLFWYSVVFIGLLPVSQIVPIITLMNDRYLYFPFLGLAVFAAAIPVRLIEKDSSISRTVGLLLVLPMLSLPFLSWKQSEVWRDSVALWSHAVIEAPTNVKARKILAEALYLRGIDRNNEGKSDEALKLFIQALDHDPSNEDVLISIVAHYEMRGNAENARIYRQRINKMNTSN